VGRFSARAGCAATACTPRRRRPTDTARSLPPAGHSLLPLRTAHKGRGDAQHPPPRRGRMHRPSGFRAAVLSQSPSAKKPTAPDKLWASPFSDHPRGGRTGLSLAELSLDPDGNGAAKERIGLPAPSHPLPSQGRCGPQISAIDPATRTPNRCHWDCNVTPATALALYAHQGLARR